MKKVISLSVIVILLFSLCLPVLAQQPRVVDDAGLLTETEVQELSATVNEISERWMMDVVIVTTNSLEGKTATTFADDYFDYNGYGIGADRDGILFLISMEDRDWAISTCGQAIDIFTDAGQEYMMETVLPYLSDGSYYDAFMAFADFCDDFCLQASQGEPYDSYNLPGYDDSYPFFTYLFLALVIGFVVALIATGVMKGKLKSVHAQAAANNYMKQGSLCVTESRDIFLYRTVTRQAKPKQTSGSSTHVSSSGRTHGGSSGKF